MLRWEDILHFAFLGNGIGEWALAVGTYNAGLISADLDEFLFGAQRISLQRVRGPLAEAQSWECFYCAGRLSTRCAVDHFLPWSRHPDNTIDNLVAAHSPCNNAKSASLAGLEHLRHWLARFQSGDPACAAIAHTASATGWPRRSDRVLSTARATYLWLPDGTRLWQQGTAYEPLEAARMRALLASVT